MADALGTFFTLLKEIARVGEDLKFNPFALGSSRCGSPSALLKEMTIAGKETIILACAGK